MTSTKIRPLSRLLDTSEAPLWVIGPDGRLVYLSAGIQTWLGVEPEQLLGRKCVAGSAVTDDPMDLLAASLSPPPGLNQCGTASLRISPAGTSPTEVRFFRIGRTESQLVFGVAGSFDDRSVDVEIQDAVAIRQRLDAWRKLCRNNAALVTVGSSRSARRLRHRLHVASSGRADTLIVGPKGCGSEVLARSLTREPSITIDGPLMDAELLDATAAPITDALNRSSEALGTVILRDMEQMSIEAQVRLAHWHAHFAGRLRLIGLSSTAGQADPAVQDLSVQDQLQIDSQQENHVGLAGAISDIVCAGILPVDSLASRVQDLPDLAAALLDAHRASDANQADRFDRNAINAIVIYPWPGEFEELEHSIRHAARAAKEDVVGMEHLPLTVRSYRPGNPVAVDKLAPVDLDQTVAEYEWSLIDAMLQSTGGNRAEAARRLGISRARLLRKIDDNKAEADS